MANRSRSKGFQFERDLVRQFNESGLPTKRAWGSNGESLGLEADVDLLVADRWPVQAKIRKTLPAYLLIPTSCAVTVFRQAYGETMALITLSDLMDLWKEVYDARSSEKSE